VTDPPVKPPDERPDALAEADAKLLRERELTTADIATQFAAKAQAAAGGADEQGELAEAMNDHLADRLEPVQGALAELEREVLAAARADSEPDTWAAWADLHAALMAVRAAQGRDARGRRYQAPREDTP
jgi:hypothetical protein